MKLFLASQGSDPKTTTKLDDYVNGLKNKKVIYIPTAKNGNGEGRWESSATWRFLNNSSIAPKCLELETFLYGLDEEQFMGSDIIWVPGGASGYLMYWIYRTGFDLILKKLLTQGKIYVGSSAGAMVTSKTLDVCEWYIGGSERGAKYIPGMGLIDFDIYPHYKDNLYSQIKKNYNGKTLYLLKDGEEIIVEDKKITVIGKERILTND